MQIQSTPDAQVINDQIVIVAPEFHLWSGRRAIKPEKLAALNPNGVTLPPAALASLGSVKLVDPEEIKVFDRIKDETSRLLAGKGLKLFGGYAIKVDDFDAVCAELKNLQAKFEVARGDLLVTLDPKIASWVTNWVAQNPDYQNLLQNLPTAVSVCDRLSFDYHTFRIAPPQDGDSEASGDYRTKLQGLRGELYREAAKEAQILMTQYLVNEKGNQREYITQKTLRPIKRVADRLRQFTFVDQAAGPLADVIEWTLTQIPAEGRVEGPPLMAIWNMARLLANPEEAARLGQLSITNGPEAAWNLFSKDSDAQQVTAEVAKPQKVDAKTDLENLETAIESFTTKHAQSIQKAKQEKDQIEVAASVVIETKSQLANAPAAKPEMVQATPPAQGQSIDLGLLF